MAARGFDAVVVGSGFGGAVCAARLAERGLRVLVLERGPFWGPLQRDQPAELWRPYPRGAAGCRKLLRNIRLARFGRRFEWDVHHDGLLELHAFEHLTALTASGVGGGSHVYTSILEQPSADFFAAYPPPIDAAELQPYFDRVRGMLRPARPPAATRKGRLFARAVVAAGLPEPQPPELAMAFGDPAKPTPQVNAAGIEQATSTYRGDVLVGSTDGSKTSLDLTYVPLALRHGAELRALCEVTAIGQTRAGYFVRFRDHRRGAEQAAVAPRLVLAAGCLNTLRLLFRARDRDRTLPNVSRALGTRLSVNGDRAAMIWRSAELEDSDEGPSIQLLTRVPEAGALRFQLGDVGLPLGALPLPWPLGVWLRRSTCLFCMGPDASDGSVSFDGSGLVSSLDRSLDPRLFEQMDAALAAVARHYRAKRLLPRRSARRRGLATVHAMGGCAMGTRPEEAVTDHLGQVFGHPGLFVADGSLYPRSPGVPPSLTIAALAERQAALLE